MTLHDAIYEVLNNRGKAMTYREIADEIVALNLYVKKDGSFALPKQISARVNNNPKLFVKEEGSNVALRQWGNQV